MATFEITGPDGKKYNISAPDGATEKDVGEYVKARFQPAPVDSSTMVGDIVESAGTGLIKGAINSTVGLPGNIEALGRLGINYAADKVGLKPLVAPENQYARTGAEIEKNFQGVVGQFHEPQTRAGKYAQTIGEFAPALIGGGAPGLINRGARVAAPAVVSETAGQLTEGTAAEPWARVGGALVGGRLTSPTQRLGQAPAPADPHLAAATQTLRNEGVTAITAGQDTGSRFLRWIEDATATTPGAGRGPNSAVGMQTQAAEQFTEAALRRAGIQGNRATAPVMNAAFTAIGQEYNALGQVAHVQPTPAFGIRVRTVAGEYHDLTPPGMQLPIVERISNGLQQAAATGQAIPGEVYNAYHSQLRAAQRSQASNPEASRAIGRMVDALDAQMIRSQPAGQQAEMLAYTRDLNTRYRNMLAVEQASRGAGEQAARGLISPAALKNAVIQQNPRDYTRGRSELGQLSPAGEAVLKPLSSSGTAERSWAHHALNAPGMFVGGLVGGGDPMAAIAGSVAPMIGKAAAAQIVMSPPVQALARQRLGGQPVPLRNSLYPAAALPSIGGNALYGNVNP